MLDKVKTFVCFGLCMGLLYYTFYLYNPTNIEIDNTKVYLLDEVSEKVHFIPYSDNTGEIDLAGLSNIIINMQNDGYKIQSLKIIDNNMDIILQNDKEVHRLYFTNENEITSISSPYNKSMVPYTYIIEKEDIESVD